MDVPRENLPRKRKRAPEHFEKPFGLDRNIALLISSHLSDKDLLNLCLVSKGFRGIFYPSLERYLITLFLRYVVEGLLGKVEEILSKNSKLALAPGDIRDLSGRHFKNITGFQYAVWSGDEELWELILKYLSEINAYNQLTVLINERPDIIKTYGVPLSFFDPLLTAYQHYMDNFEKWDLPQHEICWQKEVGGAQQKMPAWYVYMFCEEGENQAWTAQQMTMRFTRQVEHVKTWFEYEYNNGRCGSAFAFYRGYWLLRVMDGGAPEEAQRVQIQHDYENSATLKTLCTQKLAALTERLARAVKKDSSVSPMMNRK